ncbi:TetR family transcriptional regulator [Pseudomonas sp. PA-1-2A]|uniref:TetR/AcrR family transcriptional regulator n=1 Tax=Pseudomonas TaxID=286 RepID=UPI001EEF9338|nr:MULTISPECIES: TetR family transcriptional regulator C-terminal domain-containing protein [Pseudomonas]MCF5692962.1 TetR family transcriptional regulator [Pseudomonas sp. PA-1-8C]MCF5786694.1 TetR family transcriptional regulator [Pseudomonas sp. PA-1-6G]MCF5791190.1 TetR family transcriptional regulator [Pseudomonas sp. PA-1-6B]MCF5797634.1 TetR family transcriptional regulator [Pseudomonas sp. PA-1-5A]MCF5812342.1 TetR family transcriptional regulator [Pseudomonas sp. PA-1-2A]
MSRTDRKDQIIAAALELFRSKGFADVSTRDLAEHAGLSRSHVYHYFSDWNELRREAFVRFANEQLDEVREPLADAPPLEAFVGFLRDCLPSTADAGWALWLDAWDEAMHDAQMAQAYLVINAQWQSMLAEVIERGVADGVFRCESSQRAARQIFALAMGYADDLMLKPSAESAEAVLQDVLEVARLLLDFA